MSKWKEIRCDFFNEEEGKYYVDAWKTENDNEEGEVIAKIDLADGSVEYLDEDARADEYARAVINEFVSKTEISIETAITKLSKNYGSIDLLTAVVMRSHNLSYEKASEIAERLNSSDYLFDRLIDGILEE